METPTLGQYAIAPMTRLDLDDAVEWAAREGWNPGLHDGDCFYQADAQGFFMGWLGGEAIASISAVKYGESFGFIGFYIVKPDFRGQGYGMQLWQAAMASLGDRTIGLDGVLAQQENYQKSGFQLAYRNVRYEGVGTGTTVTIPRSCVPLSALTLEAVMAYDRPFFPADRTPFLTAWLTNPQHYVVGYLSSAGLTGYGVIRPCRNGYKIGPLFADTPGIAQDLLVALVDRVPAHVTFYLDVPEVNQEAIALAESYQMGRVFETARMYRGHVPEISLDRTYGVTTFELG